MKDIIFNFINILFRKVCIFAKLSQENISLRHQILIYKRTVKKPIITQSDRVFWIIVKRFCKEWKKHIYFVKPETVISWHRQGFKLFWANKSKRKPGRPEITYEIKELVKQMLKANPLWGAPRIHGELLKLGIEISEKSVSNLIRRMNPKPPSQTWKTFLHNHAGKCACDFFTVPSVFFKVLYVFVIIDHSSRKLIHFNITQNPTAEWTSLQIINAFPYNTAPKYLFRDRDGIYGDTFKLRVKNMGIIEVISAPRSPWQNAYVERVIGSIRRECTDHIIALSESHFYKTLKSYMEYYNNDRTHLGLNKDTPIGRPEQSKTINSKIIELPRLGGLHHRYKWKDVA